MGTKLEYSDDLANCKGTDDPTPGDYHGKVGIPGLADEDVTITIKSYAGGLESWILSVPVSKHLHAVANKSASLAKTSHWKIRPTVCQTASLCKICSIVLMMTPSTCRSRILVIIFPCQSQ